MTVPHDQAGPDRRRVRPYAMTGGRTRPTHDDLERTARLPQPGRGPATRPPRRSLPLPPWWRSRGQRPFGWRAARRVQELGVAWELRGSRGRVVGRRLASSMQLVFGTAAGQEVSRAAHFDETVADRH